MRNLGALGAAIALVMSLAGTAQAAPVYCSAGSPHPDGLDVGDVTFRSNDANDCYGIVETPGGNNDSLDYFNDNALWTGGWEEDLSDGAGGGDTTLLGYLGLNWTLSSPSATSGTWTLTVSDPAPDDFPVTVDIGVVINAGSKWAAYFFPAQVFSLEGSNSGTFTIQWTAGQGASESIPALSHLALYFRQVDGSDDEDPIPEPAGLLLMGTALVVGARRFRQRYI